MQRRKFVFDTKAEAVAFKRGIYFANDSALDVDEIGEEGGRHFVIVHDGDADPVDPERLLIGEAPIEQLPDVYEVIAAAAIGRFSDKGDET